MKTTSLVSMSILLAMVFPAVGAEAQGPGGGGASGGSTGTAGQGAMQQDQDQTQLRDPSLQDTVTSTTSMMEQDQMRDQDRVQLHTTTTNATTSTPSVMQQTTEHAQDRLHIDENFRVQNYEQLQSMIRSQMMLATTATATPIGAGVGEQERLREQERIATTTQNFIAVQGIVPKQIGQQIATRAMEINQAVADAAPYEERIATRSALRTFLIGGDIAAADQLDQLRTQNQQRIQDMTQLIDSCSTCTPQLRQTLQDQLRVYDQEQERLQTIADTERSRISLFGWLVGLFR